MDLINRQSALKFVNELEFDLDENQMKIKI